MGNYDIQGLDNLVNLRELSIWDNQIENSLGNKTAINKLRDRGVKVYLK